MTGVLLVDKPSGPTSHDVVARVRRSSGERSIGHTGTLDPRATGLLPLVLGRATRLASYLTSGEKTYEATIRLGFATDTDDADGEPIGEPNATRPSAAELDAALAAFRGPIEQRPPDHSAKKVAGQRAYALARQAKPVALAPVPVTVRALTLVSPPGGKDGPDVFRVAVTASAGFYVRSLARDLGARLKCGAHLAELRRTRCDPFDIAEALPLEAIEAMGTGVTARLLTPSDALPHLPAVQVSDAGLVRVRHGNAIGPDQVEGRVVPSATGPGPVRLLAADGQLVALAHSRGGALHPVLVLG